MTRDLNFPIDVIVCPTVRETDGLAMSSRNKYLAGEERQAAPILFRALNAAKELYEAGERDAENLRSKMKESLATEPRAQPQYVSCADYDSLTELDMVTGKTLLSMAVILGKTRLIDHFVLG
jgi:pantoate--beta-alanine ligase